MILLGVLSILVAVGYLARSRLAAKYSLDRFLSITDADSHPDPTLHSQSAKPGSYRSASSSPAVLFCLVIIGASTYLYSHDLAISMAFMGIALSSWYLIEQSRNRQFEGKKTFAILFHLPIGMERILMGVQAGLDVIPAIERAAKDSDGVPLDDPVSHYLQTVLQQVESGKPVSVALNLVAKLTSCIPLKHSFVHLGIAHDQGGELSTPLRDLADSAQLAYELEVEEQIATLPVKATGPLVVAFIGLIIMFLTGPIVHIVKTSEDAKMRSVAHVLH